MATSPAPLGVAVDLSSTCIDTDADRADQGCFAKVRTESGPEVVVEVRSSVKCPGMNRHPVSYGGKEGNDQSDPHDKENNKYANDPFPDGDRVGPGVATYSAATSSWWRCG
jgi:hypothetical protein